MSSHIGPSSASIGKFIAKYNDDVRDQNSSVLDIRHELGSHILDVFLPSRRHLLQRKQFIIKPVRIRITSTSLACRLPSAGRQSASAKGRPDERGLIHMSKPTSIHRVDADGVRVFYRAAGADD